MQAQAVLQVRGLRLGHGGQPLGTQALDLTVHAGQSVCVLGPNGAGKTTLFRTLLGLQPALEGEIWLDGQAMRDAARRQWARHVAYVPQAIAAGFDPTVLEVVLLGRSRHTNWWQAPRGADRQAAWEALQQLELAHLAPRRWHTLSGGQRQLVLLARALAQDTPLLVLDEPTSALDFGNQRLVLRQLRRLQDMGKAVLWSTHQPEHARGAASHVVLLRSGCVVQQGKAAEVLDPTALASLYGVEPDEMAHALGMAAPPAASAPADKPEAAPDYGGWFVAHMRREGLDHKPAAAWDRRACQYSQQSGNSGYAEAVLQRLDLSGVRTVLDVGCGSGTLALPLAERGLEVVALDYSGAMLAALRERAARAGLGARIHCLHRAWEEDWSDVPVCDLVLASRSTTVADLDAAIAKMTRHARLRAAMSYLASGHFIDPEVAALAGVTPPRMPPLQWVLGMLLARGLWPRLDYIATPSRLAGCADAHAFVQQVQWSLGELPPESQARLRAWFEADAQRAARGGQPMRWAWIAWDTPGSGE